MKFSLLISALISTTSGVSYKSIQNLNEQSQVQVLTESNRYIGVDGKPINLAETTGHARLELTKVITKNIVLSPVATTTPAATPKAPAATPTAPAATPAKPQAPASTPAAAPNKAQDQHGQSHLYQDNLSNMNYVADIYVGNPPQKIKALFDTGSTNTWILNKTTDIGKPNVPSYDNTKSTTSKKTDIKANSAFASGSLEGTFFTDDIRLGTMDDKSPSQIHIQGQKFGSVEKQKAIFSSGFQAIVGMAYPSLAEKGVTPLFDNMMGQKLLKDNIFAFYLNCKESEETGIKSDITFGYYDKGKFSGELHWNPVGLQYMYGVPLENIEFNGKMSDVCKNKKCLITFDTGATLMSMPPFATKILAQQGVPVANQVKKCNNSGQYGKMSFVIGGKKYEMSNKEWMYPATPVNKASLAQGGVSMIKFKKDRLGPQLLAQVNHDDFLDSQEINVDTDLLQAEDDIKTGKQPELDLMACASAITMQELKDEMFLVGDVFMRKFYTVFDRQNNRVGLAPAKGYLYTE